MAVEDLEHSDGQETEALNKESPRGDLPPLEGDLLNLLRHVERMINNKLDHHEHDVAGINRGRGCETRKAHRRAHPAPVGDVAADDDVGGHGGGVRGQTSEPEDEYEWKQPDGVAFVQPAGPLQPTGPPVSPAMQEAARLTSIPRQRVPNAASNPPDLEAEDQAFSGSTFAPQNSSKFSVVDKINAKVDSRRQEVLGSDHRWHVVVMRVEVMTLVLFTASFIVVTAAWIIDHEQAEAYFVTIFITAIASCAYLAKSTHMGDITIKGVQVPVARYVDWLTTTPLMLYELCHLAHASVATTMWIVGCDILMLVCGIAAAAVDWKDHRNVKHKWFALATFFYVLLVIGLQTDVARTAKDQSENVRDLFAALKWLTIFTWSQYPLVVVLGRAHLGIISRAAEDILLCILDIFSKIGMDGLIVGICTKGCLSSH